MAGEAAAGLAGDTAGRIAGAVWEAPPAPGVVTQALDHRPALVGDDRDRAEMVGVEVAQRNGRCGELLDPHADPDVADRQILVPARRS